MSAEILEVKQLTTPITTYQSQETGSRVDLVGTVHLAQPEYYTELQQFVDSRFKEDAVVQYERVRSCTLLEYQQLDINDREKIKHIYELLEGVYGLLDVPGLVKQIDAIKYHDNWQNIDITEGDLARSINNSTLIRHLGAISIIVTSFNKLDPVTRSKKIVDALTSIDNPKTIRKRIVEGVLLGSLNKPFVKDRNLIALKGLDSQHVINPEANVVLLWGSDHLPGLEKGLMRRSFKKVDEQKLIAIDSEKLDTSEAAINSHLLRQAISEYCGLKGWEPSSLNYNQKTEILLHLKRRGIKINT